jgi:aminoglycoside 3-N-acetyltransferase
MARLTLTDFRRQFEAILDPSDRIVVVYSGIWTFGHRFGIDLKTLPAALVETMLEAVGPQRTLLLPAYTYAYSGSRRFSPEKSPPETGVLPETVFKKFLWLRTRSAFNSFFVAGPQAAELAKIRGETIWGEGSLKAHFDHAHARMVVLGVPWKDACGFLHRIEESCLVPWRYFKTFPGVWEDESGDAPWVESIYVHSRTLMPECQWDLPDKLLRSRGGIRTSPGEILIESADAGALVASGRELLADDPYRLVINVDQVRHWVEHEKAREIEEMRRADPRTTLYLDGLHAPGAGAATGQL